MKNNLKLKFLLFALFACCLFVSCNGITTTVEPKDYIAPLKAAPRAVSHAENEIDEVEILDSNTDGEYNYYLLYVGYIEDLYLSTLAAVEYTGVPLSYTKQITHETSCVESLTTSVSNCITVSDSQSHKVGIGAGWKKWFPFAGEFSISANYEWNGVWSKSETNEMSTSNTSTTSKRFAETQTLSFEFKKDDGNPIGKYRYALYSTCDVYFVIQTSLNNQDLLQLTTQACSREKDYFVRMESVESGEHFENTSIDQINISEDYYKKLPLPSQKKPDIQIVEPVKYTATIRTGTTTIYNRNNHVTDHVQFNFNNMSMDEIKTKNYTKMSIELFVDIKEYRTSSDLYNGICIKDKSGKEVKKWEYKRHRGDWSTYSIETKDLNISDFYIGNNIFKLIVEYYCKNSNFQDWYLGTVKTEITIS